METKNQMEKQLKMGGVCATVWKNKCKDANGRQYDGHHVTLDRAYKDAEGNWQHTGSMRPNDIFKAVLVLQRAFEYVNERNEEPEKE